MFKQLIGSLASDGSQTFPLVREAPGVNKQLGLVNRNDWLTTLCSFSFLHWSFSSDNDGIDLGRLRFVSCVCRFLVFHLKHTLVPADWHFWLTCSTRATRGQNDWLNVNQVSQKFFSLGCFGLKHTLFIAILVSACMAWIIRRLSIRDMARGPKEQVWAKSAQ